MAPSSAIRRITIVIQQSNGNPVSSDDVALFIDWENFKISLASRGHTPNVSALKEEVSNHGRVVVGRAYADWVSRAPELKGASQFFHDPPSLYAAGIEPVYVPTRLPFAGSFQPGRTTRVKNSVDVKMTADCIDTAHNFPNINTFVLVSGDSDFIHVINSLRAVGKRVLVVGVSWATSRRMADHVDGLIFYDSDVDPISVPEPTYRNRTVAPAPLANPGRHQLPEVIRAIEDVIRSERAAGHTLLLTSLKQRLVRRIAGFDERKLGFSGFKKLMLRVADEGNIKIRSVDLVDWILMANEPDPVPNIQDADADDLAEDVAVGDYDDSTEYDEADDDGFDVEMTEYSYDTDTDYEEDQPYLDSDAGASYSTESRPPIPERPAQESARDVARMALALTEAFDSLDLSPAESGDGAVDRVADLVVMGHTLENRDGADSVMFNALCNEVSAAISAGIDAADSTIMAHWGENSSRTFVTRLVRSLTSSGVFQYRNVSVRDEDTNRRRRRRVFGLNRQHPLSNIALAARQVPGFTWPSAEFAPTNDAIATPPLDSHDSGEADSAYSAEDAEAAALTT